jgi:hypothetical protein
LLEVLPSLGSLHEHGAHAHGMLSPGRIVLTPASQVVILDWLYGPAIERLQFNRRRLWSEFGVAVPGAGGPTRLDIASDISQASLAAMMIVLCRPLRENEYPDGIALLISEVIEIAQIRGSGQFASGLEAYFRRTLPLPSRQPHTNAAEAAAEVRHIAREIGVSRCRTALTAFVEDMNRVLAEERAQAQLVADESEFDGIDAAVDELAAAMIPDLGSTPDNPLELDHPAIALDPPLETSSVTAFDEFDASARPDVFEDPPAPVSEPTSSYTPAIAEESPSIDSDAEREREAAASRIAERVALEKSREAELARPDPVPEPVIEVETRPAVAIAPVVPDPLPVRSTVPQAPEIPVVGSIPAPPLPPQEPVAPPPSVIASPQSVAAAPVVEPTPAPPPPSPAPIPAPTPAAQPQAKASKRKKRGSKGLRDKLRSNAAPPPPKPAPAPAPPPVAIPMPTFTPLPDPFRQNTPAPAPVAVQPPPPKAPAPIRLKSDAPTSAPIRLKSDSPPSTFSPPPARIERREPDVAFSSFESRQSESAFPWKLAAVGVVGVIALIGVGRYFMLSHKEPPPVVETAAPASSVAPEKSDVGKPGTVSVSTQPAGAHVLLDGKAVGDSPVTLQGVTPGKHTLTFVTSSGTVKKPIKVEAGKGLSLEVPIYSGWIAVFSPVTLDIEENGKSIGTTEQGRLMLSPGKHTLTFSSREMGYKTTQSVDIEPGEESSVSLVPTGELNANATPWAEVWIEGKKVGDTPIGALRIPLGTHEVVFKNPKYPDRQVTVTVRATAPAIAFVDFTK